MNLNLFLFQESSGGGSLVWTLLPFVFIFGIFYFLVILPQKKQKQQLQEMIGSLKMNDEIVTPYTQQALDGPNVTNIVLQDRYPGYPAGHLGVVLSPQVWDLVLEALEANPEANPQLHPQDSGKLAA